MGWLSVRVGPQHGDVASWRSVSLNAGGPGTGGTLKLKMPDGKWMEHVSSDHPGARPLRLQTDFDWEIVAWLAPAVHVFHSTINMGRGYVHPWPSCVRSLRWASDNPPSEDSISLHGFSYLYGWALSVVTSDPVLGSTGRNNSRADTTLVYDLAAKVQAWQSAYYPDGVVEVDRVFATLTPALVSAWAFSRDHHHRVYMGQAPQAPVVADDRGNDPTLYGRSVMMPTGMGDGVEVAAFSANAPSPVTFEVPASYYQGQVAFTIIPDPLPQDGGIDYNSEQHIDVDLSIAVTIRTHL